MKNLRIYLYITLMVGITTSCFEEFDGGLKENFWVSFEADAISISESESGNISTNLLFSASPQSSDVTLTYSISSPNGAENGTDYTLPPESGSVTIPAGKTSVEFVLLESVINDDIIEGEKTVVFTLESAGEFGVGFPGPDGNKKTFEVRIQEDDFTVIAFTSFEEPFGSNNYVDLINNDVDHDLVNNDGQSSIEYTSIGGELGWDATLLSTRVFTTPNGLNDHIGVSNDAATTGTFTDGVQGYRLEDTDALIRCTFDAVDISAFTTAFVRLDIFLKSTTYEANPGAVTGLVEPDNIKVYLVVDGGQRVELYTADASDPDPSRNINEVSQGVWNEHSVDISDFTTATLVIEVDTNSNAEGAIFDNSQFLGIE